MIEADELPNTQDEERLGDTSFCPRANNNMLKWSIHTIDFTKSNAPARMLGFSPGLYQHNLNHQCRDYASQNYLP